MVLLVFYATRFPALLQPKYSVWKTEEDTCENDKIAACSLAQHSVMPEWKPHAKKQEHGTTNVAGRVREHGNPMSLEHLCAVVQACGDQGDAECKECKVESMCQVRFLIRFW